MSIKDKVVKRFEEKQENKNRLIEQQAKLTIFKEAGIKYDVTHIKNEETGEVDYPIVEREICPGKIICPDCGGETMEGLEYCDKCGGELSN